MTIEKLDHVPTLRDLMLAKQDEMEAALSANRRIMPHEGEKGAASELHWREMLASYLPRRYSVANGFVVDHEGNVSEQIDVIVHDAQYSPFLFKAGTSSFVPAESIYAIFDAKQEISKKTIKDSGKKVASVRALVRTSGSVWTNDGPQPKPGKSPEDQPILGGILAVNATWVDPFGDHFLGALKDLQKEHTLDLGVAISSGAFECREEEHPIIYGKKTALVGFFMALIRKLQPLATALAMDLDFWSKELRDI